MNKIFDYLSAACYWIIKAFIETIFELIIPLLVFMSGIGWTQNLVKNDTFWQTVVLIVFFMVSADIRSYFKSKIKTWF